MEDKVSSEATNDLIVSVFERQVKRMFIIILILLVIVFGEGIGFMIYESQFDKVTITQDGMTDEGGDVNLNGVANGDINYAEGKTDNQDKGTQGQ